MSVDIGQKVLNFDEIYSVAVKLTNVRVAKILSNELSEKAPKKVKAAKVEQLDLVLADPALRQESYLRAFYLITLSQLARMKKPCRKSIVELITILLNSGYLPKGSLDEGSNVIETLINAIKEGGEVQKGEEVVSFSQIIEQSQTQEDEEEKREPPTLLSEVTPQEFFVVNSTDNFSYGVYALQCKQLELFSKRLFTSYALAFQSFKVPADAIHPLSLTKGINSKTSLIVRTSLTALLDKSQGLGKQSNLGLSERLSTIFTSLISLLQHLNSIGVILKSEINSEKSTVFLEKKSDSIQEYLNQGSITDTTVSGLIELLLTLIQTKIENCETLDVPVSDVTEELAQIRTSEASQVVRLVQASDLLQSITLQEEFKAYQDLKVLDNE